jgi:ribosome-associated protein
VKTVEYQLTQEFIELNHLLKHCGFAGSGGEGGALVSSGVIKVDGQVELRKRNKIRAGQIVVVDDTEIHVLAATTV